MSSTGIAKWALGVLGTLLTASVIWLATSVVEHGEAIARVEITQDHEAEFRAEIKDRLIRIEAKIDGRY